MTNLKIHPPLVILITISIVVLSFTFLVGGTMPYFLFYVFLLAFTLPLIHSLIILRKLKASINIPQGHLFAGESINLDYRIENRSFLPIPHLEIKSNLSQELTGRSPSKKNIALDKKDFFRHTEIIVLKRRGYYEVGDIEVTIMDVFGFYSLTKKLTNPISLLVYPKPIKLSSFQVIISKKPGQWNVDKSIFKDKNKIKNLRDYEEGDSINSIHWKLSAKRDSLIVKEYDNPGDNNLVIFIDNNINLFKDDVGRRLEDKVADTALSLVNYSLEENIRVDLETQNGKNTIRVQGELIFDLKPFLDILARFKGNGFFSLKSIIMDKIHSFNQGSTIIIITPNLNKEMGALAIELKTKNLNPIFITVTDKDNKNGYVDLEVKDFLDLENIPVYILDYNWSIKKVLEAYNG